MPTSKANAAPPDRPARSRARPVPETPASAGPKAPARQRILAAARELLLGSDGFTDLNIDAVARKAGVTRMTVYYQFGNKRGLLEAVFDELAARGELAERLPGAFQQADPEAALDAFVAAFAHFWASDRTVIKRVRSLAVLDRELEQAHTARDEWRLGGAKVILGRFATSASRINPAQVDEKAAILQAVTSFEMYDNLAARGLPHEKILSSLQALARAVVGLEPRIPLAHRRRRVSAVQQRRG
jgi:AcrR family transcriptional regulator